MSLQDRIDGCRQMTVDDYRVTDDRNSSVKCETRLGGQQTPNLRLFSLAVIDLVTFHKRTPGPESADKLSLGECHSVQ